MKSSSAIAVCETLNDARIKSIVDGEGASSWVTVTAPADSGFRDGQFYYQDRFERLADIFPIMLHFFQEEDMRRWRLKLKCGEAIIEKSFDDDDAGGFTGAEMAVFEEAFGRDFAAMAPLLRVGKAADFLSSVGIPYFEMLDQDHSARLEFPGGRYAILSEDLVD